MSMADPVKCLCKVQINTINLKETGEGRRNIGLVTEDTEICGCLFPTAEAVLFLDEDALKFEG